MSRPTAEQFVKFLEKYEGDKDKIDWAEEYILQRYVK